MREKKSNLDGLLYRTAVVILLSALLLLPLAAIAAATWLIVTATTPDILPFRYALLIGVVAGTLAVAMVPMIASLRASGTFPDYGSDIAIPCAIIIVVCGALQPVAARSTRERLKNQPLSRPSAVVPWRNRADGIIGRVS